jgi:hypothetical protein
MPLAQVGRPVGAYGAEAQPVGVDPLDVDRRERSLELACNLHRDRDAAAGHTDDHRLVELEPGDGHGQGPPGGGAIAKERRDPSDETHALIVPGPFSRKSGCSVLFRTSTTPSAGHTSRSRQSATAASVVRLRLVGGGGARPAAAGPEGRVEARDPRAQTRSCTRRLRASGDKGESSARAPLLRRGRRGCRWRRSLCGSCARPPARRARRAGRGVR